MNRNEWLKAHLNETVPMNRIGQKAEGRVKQQMRQKG